jgi:hypothetical protein
MVKKENLFFTSTHNTAVNEIARKKLGEKNKLQKETE